MIYALVKNGVVVDVERRTADGYKIEELYHGSLVPFFIVVPKELESTIQKGWIHDFDKGFREPKPFEINPETGEMYLPAGIPAEIFWRTASENIRLQNEVQQLTAVVDTLLIENLTEKGALLSD